MFAILGPSISHSAVTVSAVERASVVEGTGTATVTVYGGVAGDTARCNSTASDSLCDNCRLLDSETVPNADADQYLLACNNRRVHPDLQLVISLSSDAVDGRATITNSDGNTALAPVSAPLNLGKGTTGQLVLRWGDLCSRVISLDVNSGGEGATQCAPVNGHASASLRVGISSDGDDLLNAATDEYRTMTVIVRGASGVSLATDCDDVSTDSRICYFEMGPGDEKAVVRALQKPDGNSFPTGTNTTYKYLRFLFDAQGFNYVHLGSNYVDLPVSAADTTTFNVSPRRIEGLVNDVPYYFKIAAIDAAGNVGLYNGKATDSDCQYSVNPLDTTCRVVTPSEVVGVLDKTNCFIATAAYGTPFASELNVLRDFRDQILMKTAIGRAFVRAYYFASPVAAQFILKHDALRDLTRKALVPFVWFAGISLSIGANAVLWFLISLAIALTAVVHVLATRPRKSTSLNQQQNKQQSDNRDQSRWLPLILGISVGLAQAAPSPAEAQVEPLEDATSSTPIEALEDDSAPPAEYPYPGSTEVAPATAPTKKKRTKTVKSIKGEKFSDTPTPVISNGWGEKPKHVNEDGDFIYESLGETPPKNYGEPEPVKFSGTPGREAPSTITVDGEFHYPVATSEFSGAGGIRFGLMAAPDIINGSNGLSFKDIYGSAEVPALLFEYEYPLSQAIGRIGIKAESGFIATSAKGRFKNPARAGEIPEERFTFLMVPLQASVIYRFQFADNQWLVPFVEGGGGYYGIVELRDDSKAPKFGGSPVAVAAGGVNILLDWLDRQAVRQLDADYGINHVWLSLQYRQIIGMKEDLKISSNLITAGFTFDF